MRRFLKAFTLLELLLAIIMLIILGMMLGPVLNNVVLSSNLIFSRREVIAEARNGMERMVSEIRLTPNTNVLASITATNLQFQYPAGTAITYSLSNGNLMRNSDILVAGVSSIAFSYYNEAGNNTATAANVRSIGIKFTTTSPTESSSLTLQTRVFLRNTGHNYATFTSP